MAGRPDYDVLIVGGGPVGLLLGNLLDRQGLSTLLIEKEPAPPAESMAIGITPPSLELLQQLALADEFVRSGIRVDLARVHEGGKRVGVLRFHGLDSPFPFILAIPQATTIALLEARLKAGRRVTLRRATTLLAVDQTEDYVTATMHRRGQTEQATASFLIGCDGHRSSVRAAAGIALVKEKHYPTRFFMADFADTTDLGREAHLFFSRHGSIESFPLPEHRRRWIMQTNKWPQAFGPEELATWVARQTGHDLTGADCFSASAFSVRRSICESYARQRLVLCGDAAHVMSPVGGQGMNTGFADAEFLAAALARHCSRGEDYAPLLAGYDHYRRIAFNAAADRAERGMWLGTRRGRLASALRFLFIKSLLGPLFCRSLPAYFAMLTIPYRSLKTVGNSRLVAGDDAGG